MLTTDQLIDFASVVLKSSPSEQDIPIGYRLCEKIDRSPDPTSIIITRSLEPRLPPEPDHALILDDHIQLYQPKSVTIPLAEFMYTSPNREQLVNRIRLSIIALDSYAWQPSYKARVHWPHLRDPQPRANGDA